MLVLTPSDRPSVYDMLGLKDKDKHKDITVSTGVGGISGISGIGPTTPTATPRTPPRRTPKSTTTSNANSPTNIANIDPVFAPKIPKVTEKDPKPVSIEPTPPFLWIQKADMKLAVEKIRNFLVRRSSTVTPININQLKLLGTGTGTTGGGSGSGPVVGARKQSKAMLNFHLSDLQNGINITNNGPTTPTRPNGTTGTGTGNNTGPSGFSDDSIERMRSISTSSNNESSPVGQESRDLVHDIVNNTPMFGSTSTTNPNTNSNANNSADSKLPLHLKHTESDIEKALQGNTTHVRYIPPTPGISGSHGGSSGTNSPMNSPDHSSQSHMFGSNSGSNSNSNSPSTLPAMHNGVNNMHGSAHSGMCNGNATGTGTVMTAGTGMGISINSNANSGIGSYGMGNSDSDSPWNQILSRFHKNTQKDNNNDGDKPTTPCGNVHGSVANMGTGNTPERRKGTHNLFAVDISALMGVKSKPKLQKDIPRYMAPAKANDVYTTGGIGSGGTGTGKAHKVSMNVTSNSNRNGQEIPSNFPNIGGNGGGRRN